MRTTAWWRAEISSPILERRLFVFNTRAYLMWKGAGKVTQDRLPGSLCCLSESHPQEHLLAFLYSMFKTENANYFHMSNVLGILLQMRDSSRNIVLNRFFQLQFKIKDESSHFSLPLSLCHPLHSHQMKLLSACRHHETAALSQDCPLLQVDPDQPGIHPPMCSTIDRSSCMETICNKQRKCENAPNK